MVVGCGGKRGPGDGVRVGLITPQEQALRTYAAQGYQLVFGHGFEFQDPAERVAAGDAR
jgi:basic membrane lipoprotein Med (substrate-binding protein (PBP1-ABC) superfamily)